MNLSEDLAYAIYNLNNIKFKEIIGTEQPVQIQFINHVNWNPVGTY